jgi:ribonuclease VapC
MPDPVLDASALLALLGNEPGADTVAEAVTGGAVISTVNLAEVLSTLAMRGRDPAGVLATLQTEGILDGAITVSSFTIDDAREAARLHPLTKVAGLSLGARACLALAKRLDAHALTAEQDWLTVQLDVEVRILRERADDE